MIKLKVLEYLALNRLMTLGTSKNDKPWADDFSSDHKLYLIKPLQIWYIDQSLFGHFHRVRIK